MSLGGVYPAPPRTRRGTMVTAEAAARPPRNLRRVRAMRGSLRRRALKDNRARGVSRASLPRRRCRRGGEPVRDLESLPVLARQQRVRLLVVLEGLRLAVEHERVPGEIRDVREVRERRGEMSLHDLAREDLRIVRPDRIDEVLVVRELDAGQDVRIAARSEERRVGIWA